MRISRRFALVAFVGAVAAGCAAASTPKALTPPPAIVSQHHTASVSVQVTGGEKANDMGVIGITNEDFRAAIIQAIRDSQVFAGVEEGDRGAYSLHVHILKLDQPFFGASMTVKMETAWRLVRAGSDEAILEADIASSHTTGASEAFVGATRVRLANEGAARENIRIGIERLSRAHVE
jgi:hypothetical protein